MQGSEYTSQLVQASLPVPSKLVLMCDKQKRRWVCMRQVYKSSLDGLLPSILQGLFQVEQELFHTVGRPGQAAADQAWWFGS